MRAFLIHFENLMAFEAVHIFSGDQILLLFPAPALVHRHLNAAAFNGFTRHIYIFNYNPLNAPKRQFHCKQAQHVIVSISCQIISS